MNDVTEIAKLLVGLISPALPFLIKIGEKVSESVASDAVKSIGNSSWEKAQRIWAKLSPQAQKKESARQALKKVIQRPDEFSQGALIGEIRDILEENIELAQELLKLLQEKDSESHSVDDRSVNVQSGGVSIRGSSKVGGKIIGGNHHKTDDNLLAEKQTELRLRDAQLRIEKAAKMAQLKLDEIMRIRASSSQEYYEKLLQGDESSMLAAYLAQNPDNIATLISRLDQQKQIASGSNMEMLKIMIEEDTRKGGSGKDLIFGGDDNDLIYDEEDNDVAQIRDMGARFSGLDGDDVVTGGKDNDFYIRGNAGFDTLVGGTGNDIYIIDSTTDTITEPANEGTDTIYGDGGTYTLRGGDGNDYLDGGEGSDTINGGDGDGLVFGLRGADNIDGDQDTFVNRYIHVEMDSEVLIQRVTTVEVKISNNLISIVNDSTSKSAEVKVDLSNSLIVQVIPKVNFENVGETRIEISPFDLEEQHNIYFDLRATHIGEGEIWVVFSQSQFPLLTLALTPKIVENKTRTSQRISKNGEVPPILKATEPLHQLCIIERRNGNQISYQYELNSPSLNLLGLYESKLITSNRQEYVENLYREIESRWLSVQGDVDAFECELRAFGGQILDELFPEDLQRQLWEYRHNIQSIMVISTEPFIPWELVHLKPPRQSFLPEEVYFLGQMGLVRWLYDVGFPPESITIRPQRCYYVIPHYPDARYRLLQAEQEVQFLEQLFQATAIEPQPIAVRKALESTSFDLLHFAGHGHADVNITTSAKLLLEGRIENGQYIHTYLSATTVGQFSRLKSFQNQPIVMINACQIGRLGYVLTGMGGFAQAFLKGGAGVFIGTLWSVGDQPARIFSETFYTSLIEGETLANATRKARESAKLSGDATWLAYVVYGHPHLKVTLNQDIDL